MGNWFALFWSSAGFAGFIPGLLSGGRVRWGGVMGSLVGVALQVYCMSQPQSLLCQLALIGASWFIGGATIPAAEQFMLAKWGPRRRHTGAVADHDFNETCIDEVHGQLIASLPVYLLVGESALTQGFALGAAFAFFRFFDVTKFGPVKWAEERLPGALGIMADDSIAGLLAAGWLTVVLLVGWWS